MSTALTYEYESECRDRMRALIREKSIRVVDPTNQFTLSSGEKSCVYCDLKKSALLHEATEPLSTLILSAAAGLGSPDAFAGVALGGCHLASIASANSAGASAIHVRKEAKSHGTKSLVEAPDLPVGSSVVLVEDTTTTANSALKALAALQGAGYRVLGIVTVVDRRNAWKPVPLETVVGGVPFRAIFRIEELCDGEPEYTVLQEAADHGSPI